MKPLFNMTYQEQLQTIEWTQLRFQILQRDKYQCQVCRTSDNLNVHHLFYIRGRKAWEYNHNLLITLCERHHMIEHDSLKVLKDYHIKEQLISGMLAIDIILKINAGETIEF